MKTLNNQELSAISGGNGWYGAILGGLIGGVISNQAAHYIGKDSLSVGVLGAFLSIPNHLIEEITHPNRSRCCYHNIQFNPVYEITAFGTITGAFAGLAFG